MQKESGQIIRILRPSDEPDVDAQTSSNALDHLRSGYYFLISKKETKRRKKSVAVQTLTTFGPFAESHMVRFIETSAYALGLLQADPVLASTPHKAEVAPPSPAREEAAIWRERVAPQWPPRPAERDRMAMH